MSTLNYDKNNKAVKLPDWTMTIPEPVYHAASAKGEYVSSGMLREFHLCPFHYRELVSGVAVRPDGDAFRMGRAAHKLMLEGEAAFRAAFIVGGPVNERTGRSFGAGSRAFEEWLHENGLDKRMVLTLTEADTIRRMRAAAFANTAIRRLFDEGRPERSTRAELAGVPCQIRLDWLRSDGIAVDVKTVEDITRFEADARRFGYLHQFAFYRETAAAAGGGELAMTAVVLEKKPPHRAGVWEFSADTLAPYVEENRRALASLRRCRESGKWPTGYEKPRHFPPAGIPPVWLN